MFHSSLQAMNVNVTPIWSSWAFCRCTSNSRNVTGLIMDSERQNASESGPQRCLRITLPHRRWRLDTPRTLQVLSTGGVSLLVRCHSCLFKMPGSCFWFALTQNCISTSHESPHTHKYTITYMHTHVQTHLPHCKSIPQFHTELDQLFSAVPAFPKQQEREKLFLILVSNLYWCH